MLKKESLILRKAIIYCINNSVNKSNDSLKNYVMNEMSTVELLSVIHLGKVITEGDGKLNLPDWAVVPFHVLAGGALTGAISAGLGKVSRGKFQQQIGHSAGTIASAAIAFGATMLARAVYFMYKKSIDQCTHKCRKSIRPGKNYPQQVSICYHQCQVQTLNFLIAKLRSESTMCNQSKYPEKCTSSINSQIVKYQSLLEKELYTLNKQKQTLMARLRKIPASMSMKPSSEKPENNSYDTTS